MIHLRSGAGGAVGLAKSKSDVYVKMAPLKPLCEFQDLGELDERNARK